MRLAVPEVLRNRAGADLLAGAGEEGVLVKTEAPVVGAEVEDAAGRQEAQAGVDQLRMPVTDVEEALHLLRVAEGGRVADDQVPLPSRSEGAGEPGEDVRPLQGIRARARAVQLEIPPGPGEVRVRDVD